ncbi:MAG TPA: ATP-binding protein [Rhodocyclaceae bacterium]|nr:ATP-binding protein [Rhodocyclaceae bacterium]
MIEELGRLLIQNGFLPHGYCISWSAPLIGTYVVSDLLIGVSYFSMPVAIGYFARRRPDFPYPWLLWMFAAFILACGTTHLVGTLILWQPLYWLDAGLKALTALISVATAVTLWPMLPRALGIPSPRQLQAVNEELRSEIAERLRVEEELRLANEALLRSNLDLQHFAHVAAHDLQTPLRSISLFTQLLRRNMAGRLDPEAEEWMARVAEGTNRMQSLIDDLLAYARLDSQARPFEATDCQRLFEEVKANLAERIRERWAEVACSRLPTVGADRIQLAQVLQNLIENGIKYNTAETPRIVVAAERQGEEWVFSVADNGIGIDPKYHQRVFEIFRRLHTQQEYPGSGIGLAICTRIMERHGGRLWVDSREGAGSTFYFTLPATAAADRELAPTAEEWRT